VLAFWDMRKEANPVTLLSTHADSVLEVMVKSYVKLSLPKTVFSNT